LLTLHMPSLLDARSLAYAAESRNSRIVPGHFPKS
jgi:hypothetical protein